jgi:prepilin-type N-terminal cleavage/methylation domain-containing protein
MRIARVTRQTWRSLMAARGFTLIELGVVLAVISIMAAAVMVDVVEIFKNRAAQNNAEELYVIQQAAKDFFHATIKGDDDKIDPLNAHWPGEGGAQTCATVANSQPAITQAILQDLKDEQYLKADFAGKNAWDQSYIIDLMPGGGNGGGPAAKVFDCAFWIATDVPSEVAGVIETYLPLGKCGGAAAAGGCGNAAIAGYTRCCTQIPKPGIEASMALAKDAFDRMIIDSGHNH